MTTPQALGIKGVLAALTTPFKVTGEVDYRALENQTIRVGEGGVAGFFCGGTTGSFRSMPDIQERLDALGSVCRFAWKASPKLPVYFHVGSSLTSDSVKMAAHGASVGVAAISSILPPASLNLDVDAVLKYFEAIIEAAKNTPVGAYLHPQAMQITPKEFGRLFRELPLDFAKISAGTMAELNDFRDAAYEARSAGEMPVIFCGNDALLAEALEAEYRSFVSGNACVIAKVIADAIQAFIDGKMDVFQACMTTLDKFRGLTKNGDLTHLHAAQEILGIISCCQMRGPVPTLGLPERTKLAAAMQEIGIK